MASKKIIGSDRCCKSRRIKKGQKRKSFDSKKEELTIKIISENMKKDLLGYPNATI